MGSITDFDLAELYNDAKSLKEDHVVDLGPGAGSAGGEVVFQGRVEGLRARRPLRDHRHRRLRQELTHTRIGGGPRGRVGGR